MMETSYRSYDIKNGSTRSISFANLRAAVPYLESVEYSVPNLILTQSDGDQFTIDISNASDIIDDTVTSGSVVKWDADQELFTYAGATVDSDTGVWTFDSTIEVPSGSLFVSDTLSISEATYELFVHEHVIEQNAIGIQSVLDDTGSYQPFINAAGDQFTSTAQSEFDTTITTNPLVLPLASSSNIQTNVFRLKTAAAMTNFRMKLVDDDSGVVIKYIPSKIAVESGEGGLDLPAGDVEINLNSEAEDTSDTFNFGFTPLRSIEARATTLTIEADSIQLLGNSSGVPYVQNELQKLFQLNIPYIFDTSNIEDNYSRLNAGYVTESGTTGGLVVNYEATSTKDTVTTQLFNEGVDGSANPFVTTDGSDTFATSDIIQITGSKFNNGFYEVLSHSGTTLTIRGVGVTATVEDFSRDQWLEVTDSAAITKINVNVLRSSDTGVWQTGAGSTTPITYTDVDTITYTGGDGIDITSEEISIDLAQAIAAGDLVLSNQIIGSFDGTYTPATVSGYLDASRNFVEDSSYKVFKRDAGGGQYYTIFWELLTFNEWYIAVSTIDPDTWTDGNATGVIQAGEYGLTTDSETQDGQNVPAADANISYTTEVLTSFLDFNDDGQIFVDALDEDDMASDSATQLATQQSIKAYVDSQSGTDYTAGDGIDIDGSDVISVNPISEGDDGDRDLHLTSGLYEGVYTKSTFEGYISSAGVVTEDSSYVIYRRSQNDGTYVVIVWENNGSDWDVYTTSTNPDNWVDGGASGVGTPQLVTTQTQVYQSQNYPSSDDADVDYYVRQVGSFLAFDVGGELLVSVLDEDDLDSDSPDHIPTQQSVKAYVDNSASGVIAGDGIDVTSETISIDVAEAVPENRLVLSDMAVNAANGVYEIAAFSGQVNSTNGNAIENSSYRVYKKRQSNGDYYAAYYEASPSAEWVATNCGNNDPDTWADGEGTGTFGETAYLITQSDDTQDGQFVPTAADDNVDYTSAVASGFIHFTQTDREAYIAVLDEDDMASDSDTNVPTQQSVKAYVDQSAPNIYNTNGTLTGDREVFGTDGSYFAIDVADGTQSTFVNRCLFSLLPTSSPRLDLYYVKGNGLGTDSDLVGFELSDTGTVYTDEINTKPPELAADYSANFVDRSLVDKAYVDGEINNFSAGDGIDLDDGEINVDPFGSTQEIDVEISGISLDVYNVTYTLSTFMGYIDTDNGNVTADSTYVMYKHQTSDGSYLIVYWDDDSADWQAGNTLTDPDTFVGGETGVLETDPAPRIVASLSRVIDGDEYPADTDPNVDYQYNNVGSYLAFKDEELAASVLDDYAFESDSHLASQLSIKNYAQNSFLSYQLNGVDQVVSTGNGNAAFTITSTGSGAVDSPTFRFDNGWRVGNDEILSVGRDTPLRFDDGNVFSDVMTIQHDSSSGGFNSIDYHDVRTVYSNVRNLEWEFGDDTANSQWRVFDSSASEILNLQRDGSLTLGGVIYANRSYIQYSNGSDVSTNLNTGSAAAIPIFNSDEDSNNDNGDFTINSSTQAEVNFTGKIKIGYTFTSVISDGAGRVSLIGRVAINGTATGPESRSYLRGSDGCNEGTNQIHPIYIDVTDGDTIEITSQRGGTTTSTATFNTTSQNYVTVERVS